MQFKDKFIDLSSPKVMGILNVTPDSFSDGGNYHQLESGLYQVEQMLKQGADFIDVGGESTRPGATAVSLQQELDRVIPVIEQIRQRFDTVISIDTSKAEVMKQAVNAGAGLINDVRALQQEDALGTAANLDVPVCLMHMQGQPAEMQNNPYYQNILLEVRDFFERRVKACVESGIDRTNIIIDPGFGFGKTLEHNYQLLSELRNLANMGFPILSGTSRKSMLGHLLNRQVDERLAGSIVTATLAVQQGANIIRVHDVKETVDAIKVITFVTNYRNT